MWMPGLLEKYHCSLVPQHHFSNTFLDRAPLKGWFPSPRPLGSDNRDLSTFRRGEHRSWWRPPALRVSPLALLVPVCRSRRARGGSAQREGDGAPAAWPRLQRLQGDSSATTSFGSPTAGSAIGSWHLWSLIR